MTECSSVVIWEQGMFSIPKWKDIKTLLLPILDTKSCSLMQFVEKKKLDTSLVFRKIQLMQENTSEPFRSHEFSSVTWKITGMFL